MAAPFRILHASNFTLRAKGAFLHGVPRKLTNGLIRNGHQVIAFSDRDEADRAGFGIRALGVAAANKALLRLCRAARPDLLVIGHADVIAPATIARIRAEQPGLRVLQWNVDPLFEPGNAERLTARLAVVDATLVSSAETALAPLRRPGKRLGFLPNPVDFSIETGTAHLLERPEFDLFYACGHPSRPLRNFAGRDWNMEDFAAALRARLPDLRACMPGLFGAPHLSGADYQDALAGSAIGLNVSRRNDVPLYSSDRLAQTIGNGQAVLIDRACGYGRLFGEDEMLFFSSLDDIVAQISRAMAEPGWRQAVAAAGRARYHALFNEQAVAAYLVDVAFDRLDPASLPWPSLVA